MIICSGCKKEMTCTMTGKRVVFGTDYVYSGDEYRCPECGAVVVHTAGEGYYSPNIYENVAPLRILQMPN